MQGGYGDIYSERKILDGRNFSEKMDCQPGGPFVIQMLFKNPVELPEKEHMTDVMQQHIGTTECSCCDDNMVGFTALDYVVELEEGKKSYVSR